MHQILERFFPPLMATLIASFGVVAAHAYDDLPRPPRPPRGSEMPPPKTEKSVTKEVEDQITRRFASAGGSDGQLSRVQAKAAGWGLVSDHFEEIDRSGSGYVGLADILNFMAGRTPQQIMRNSAAAASKAGG